MFILSLRAGGVGMNLTGADYVLHLDPWWNPAVEDQATDRAHRIGQSRPVTVYRLVSYADGTLEQLARVARGVRGPCERLELARCGHSPFRDQPQRTLQAVARFVNERCG